MLVNSPENKAVLWKSTWIVSHFADIVKKNNGPQKPCHVTDAHRLVGLVASAGSKPKIDRAHQRDLWKQTSHNSIRESLLDFAGRRFLAMCDQSVELSRKMCRVAMF